MTAARPTQPAEPDRADRLVVLGIGADGTAGLSAASLDLLRAAPLVYGSPRQLAAVANVVPADRRRQLPSPLLPTLDTFVTELRESGGVLLASGDPMFHGIGSTLARYLGPEALDIRPAPSSASLAAAAMGWPLADLPVISLLTAPPEAVLPALRHGRVLVLARDSMTPIQLAATLADAGHAGARLTVLSDLGAENQVVTEAIPAEAFAAEAFAAEAGGAELTQEMPSATSDRSASAARGWSDLCIVAVEADPTAIPTAIPDALLPGLDDDRFAHDGQITKRLQRIHTLGLLAPRAGDLLWDVGGGAGSIAIEWLRVHPSLGAVSFERDPGRAERIADNALRLGVPRLRVAAAAPESFAGESDDPDAVFVGGGVTAPGMLDECWSRLRPGGRLVAAAVTLESEMTLARFHQTHGGELTRISLETAAPLGTMTGWTPSRAVVHLVVTKPHHNQLGTPRNQEESAS